MTQQPPSINDLFSQRRRLISRIRELDAKAPLTVKQGPVDLDDEAKLHSLVIELTMTSASIDDTLNALREEFVRQIERNEQSGERP